MINEFDFEAKLKNLIDFDYVGIADVFEIIINLNNQEDIANIFEKMDIDDSGKVNLIEKLCKTGLSALPFLEKIKDFTKNKNVKEICESKIEEIIRNRSISISEKINNPEEIKTFLKGTIELIKYNDELKTIQEKFSNLDEKTKEKREIKNKIDIINKKINDLNEIAKNENLTNQKLEDLKKIMKAKDQDLEELRKKIKDYEKSNTEKIKKISEDKKKIKEHDDILIQKTKTIEELNLTQTKLIANIDKFESEIISIKEKNNNHLKISSFYEKRREYFKNKFKHINN